jgi:hypothetical protein
MISEKKGDFAISIGQNSCFFAFFGWFLQKCVLAEMSIF